MRADGVFSGGGVKGIAFAGAIEAAAEAGYSDWACVAGTSAGAIAAMTLALGYAAPDLRRALEETPYGRIGETTNPLTRLLNLIRRHGVTKGDGLSEWIGHLVKAAPSPAAVFGELDGRLKVVGCDLAHSRLVVFPDDVGLYEDEGGKQLRPDDFPVAEAVRISAGYPYFFPPVALRDRATGKHGVLVDGGVASAFPVFLFDRPNPSHPTWGFRLHGGLGAERPSQREIGGLDWPADMAWGILDTAMNAFDAHEVLGLGDRVVSIPTGSVGTLDFQLSQGERDFLYRSGYETARTFFAGSPKGRNSLGEVPASS